MERLRNSEMKNMTQGIEVVIRFTVGLHRAESMFSSIIDKLVSSTKSQKITGVK